MRAVLQRVTEASVSANGCTNTVGRGILVLLGITHGDTTKDADYIVRKILNTKLWDDAAGKRWQKSVTESDFEILFSDAAKELFDYVVKQAKVAHKAGKIQEGFFGEMMQVALVNDGPVTIIIDTEPSSQEGKGQDGAQQSSSAPATDAAD